MSTLAGKGPKLPGHPRLRTVAGTAGPCREACRRNGGGSMSKRLTKIVLRVAVLGAVVVSLVFSGGCGQKETQLNLYVAAGLKKPMDKVIAIFEQEKGVKVIPNYAASGALYTQIKEGQPCDLFFSADWMYVEKLKEDGKLASGQKFLQDNLVLIVSNSAKDKVKSVEDLVKPGVTVGICDPSAPVGVYAENALKKLNLWDKLSTTGNLKAHPSTVNQLAIMVQKDELDAGLIFSSVARSFGVDYVQTISQEYTGEIIFGAAIIKGGNEKLAQEFLDTANKHIDEFTSLGWQAYKQ